MRWYHGLPLASLALAQTPPNYPPSTNNPLIVTYGDLVLTPNELVSENKTQQQPTISLPRRRHHPRHWEANEKLMVLMLDLSINITGVPIPENVTSIAAAGLEPNRTTYLHWFQGNLTTSYLNGILTPTSDYAIAPYSQPSPNPGDIPHTYVFYLLPQPQGFVLPAEDLQRRLQNVTGEDRIGFDVRPIIKESGGVVAGMYTREQGAAS